MTTRPREVHHANFAPELTNWSVVFAPLFSKRVWCAVRVLLTRAILAIGARTVTAVLRVMGLAHEKQFQKYHRVLNRAKWSSLAASLRLLHALLDAFVPIGPLLMTLDDTIERRRGARIVAKGIYRDPVRSSRSHLVKASGLRWLLPDVAGADSLGGALLGIAALHGAGTLATVLPGSPTATEYPDRQGAPALADGQTLVAQPGDHGRDRQQPCRARIARGCAAAPVRDYAAAPGCGVI